MALGPKDPDWRWLKILDLNKIRGDIPLHARLQTEDELIVNGVKYLRKERIGLGASEYPAIHEALTVYSSSQGIRKHLEAFIVAGADNDKIEEYLDISPDGIDAYVNYFLDIRERKKGVVAAMLFQGFPNQTTHANDHLGFARRLGWFGGVDTVEDWILGRGIDPEVRKKVNEMIKGVLSMNAFEMALTIGKNVEESTELLKLTLIEEKSDDDSSSKSNEGMEQFIGNFALTVADPTKVDTMMTSAREKRVTDYEVHGT
jgi:hypothetical protein